MRSKLPRARTAARTTFGTVSRVVTVRWATTSRTVHAAQSEGVAHWASSRSATWSASRRRSAATAPSIAGRDSDGALIRRP